MDNSILVGKYLYSILSQNTEVTNLVDDDKILPLLAMGQEDNGEFVDIKFPFIVYTREDITPVYTKDILTENLVKFTILCVDKDYINCLDVANAVRHALEGKRYSDENIRIFTIKLDSIQEDLIENAYVQTLHFSFSVS
jgi:hypothetical protein